MGGNYGKNKMNNELNKKIVVRSRGIIIHDGNLLVVKHSVNTDFYALPGGHLEWGEKVQDSIKREITEELGVKPQIGRLLYVNNFIDTDQTQSVEFFFEIVNSADYLDVENLGGTHKHEIVEICWIKKNDTRKVLPSKIQKDLNDGTILSDIVRFL